MMPALARDDGFTLIEMVITMTVMATIMTLTSVLFMSGQYTYQTAMVRADLETNARRCFGL